MFNSTCNLVVSAPAAKLAVPHTGSTAQSMTSFFEKATAGCSDVPRFLFSQKS